MNGGMNTSEVEQRGECIMKRNTRKSLGVIFVSFSLDSRVLFKFHSIYKNTRGLDTFPFIVKLI